MLKGDLATTPLPAVLLQLADGASTGCLRVTDDDGEDAKAYLRGGQVYAVALPDRPAQLGPRLVASGVLDADALAEAYEAQREELQGWRIGELLVHLGYLEQDVVERFVAEQLREAAAELLLRTSGRWRFRVGERTREDVAPAVPVAELLPEVERLHASWNAVPVLSAAGTSPDTVSVDPAAWSLLCAVDGTSTLARLADGQGLSLPEATAVLAGLVEAGLLELAPPVAEVTEVVPEEPAAEQPSAVEAPVAEVAPEEPAAEIAEPAEVPAPITELPEPLDEPTPLPTLAPVEIASRLAEALRGLGPMPVLPPSPLDPPRSPAPPVEEPDAEPALEPVSELVEVAERVELRETEPVPERGPAMVATVMDGEELTRTLTALADDEDVAGSLSRASESLSVLLGSAVADPEPERTTGAITLSTGAPLDEREAKRRARDAEELAERHAELEAAHAAERAEAEPVEAVQPVEPAELADSGDVDALREAAQMQAAAFAELSAAASLTSYAAEPELVDVADDPEPAPAEEAPERLDEPAYPPRGADTAALLRELSSLGLEDEPGQVPQPRPAAPGIVRPLSSAALKKRKGLFGRA